MGINKMGLSDEWISTKILQDLERSEESFPCENQIDIYNNEWDANLNWAKKEPVKENTERNWAKFRHICVTHQQISKIFSEYLKGVSENFSYENQVDISRNDWA